LALRPTFVWVDGETRTNVSIVSAENGQYVKVNEPGPTINEADLAQLAQKIRDLVQAGDWWVLAGSLPPGVEPGYYTELITIIQSAGAKVFLDTSDEALRQNCGAKPLLVKPNDEEAHALTGLPVNTPAEISAVGMAISAMGPASVIISLGKVGAVLVDEGKAWLAASPKIVAPTPLALEIQWLPALSGASARGTACRMRCAKGLPAVLRPPAKKAHRWDPWPR
jgi:1-phosphofructokinase family hexose kinase